MYKIMILLLVMCLNICGQQPFNPYRSLTAGNSSFCPNGILCVDLNDPNSAPAGSTIMALVGPHLQTYFLYVALSAPIPNNIATQYGIVDIDLPNAFVWLTGTYSFYPAPSPQGTNIDFFSVDVTTIQSPFNASLQALITNPSNPNGYVLSNALHYFK